jgi:hypothetical protein
MRTKQKEAALATPPLQQNAAADSSGSRDSAQSRLTQDARQSWRDVLPVHPAANLFPLLPRDELLALGRDILDHGLQHPIVLLRCGGDRDGTTPKRTSPNKFQLLDGRNRVDAMAAVGIKFEIVHRYRDRRDIWSLKFPDNNVDCPHDRRTVEDIYTDDPFAYVVSANIHRRHLTGEQKRELIAKILKAKPEASNRQIAKQVKADDKTVAKVRRELESTAEIPQLEKTVGADGKQRKSRATEPEVQQHTASVEISVEQRRAAWLVDETTEETIDEVDQRVSDVFDIILRHVEGLSPSETGRFFAALRDRINDLSTPTEETEAAS